MTEIIEIQNLIANLQKVDTEEFYNKKENEVEKEISSTINKLIQIGEPTIFHLSKLLQPHTWSCYFAIKVMRKIKSPKSISFLINFLKLESDDDYSNEEALYSLIELKELALDSLIQTIEEEFNNKSYNCYITGALGEIKHPKSYNFITDILKDFLKNPNKYKNWFYPDFFASELYHQENKEAISLLKQLKEKIGPSPEIEDTLSYLKDPVEHERKTQEEMRKLGEVMKKEKEEIKKKIKELGLNEKLVDVNASMLIPNKDGSFKIDLAFNYEELEKIRLCEITIEKLPVIINDFNIKEYEIILSEIDSLIYDYYQKNKSIKDTDIIENLKIVRDNFDDKFEKLSLSHILVSAIKSFLLVSERKYSVEEIKLCISKVLNSVKYHRKESGSRGYLNFISEFFENPENFSKEYDNTDKNSKLHTAG